MVGGVEISIGGGGGGGGGYSRRQERRESFEEEKSQECNIQNSQVSALDRKRLSISYLWVWVGLFTLFSAL